MSGALQEMPMAGHEDLRALMDALICLRDQDLRLAELYRARIPRMTPRGQRRTAATVRKHERAVRLIDQGIRRIRRICNEIE
jgi:hypothetical protein